MTRSEERLHVGTEQVETGRARLRKYIVTENVTQTVPVSHEEVRVEREPITDANRGEAMSGGDLTEEEHEVTLHAERPVVCEGDRPGRARPARHRHRHRGAGGQREVRKEQIDTTAPTARTSSPRLGQRATAAAQQAGRRRRSPPLTTPARTHLKENT